MYRAEMAVPLVRAVSWPSAPDRRVAEIVDKLGRGPRLRRRATGASSICVLGAARVRPVVRVRYDPGGRNRGAEVACICRLVKAQR